MSEPSTDVDPLPQRADIPVPHLSRPSPSYSRRISHSIGQSLSQSAAPGGDGAGSSSDGGISRPAAAVTRPDGSVSLPTSPAVDASADFIASIERGPFSQDASKPTPSNAKIEEFHPERRAHNPYEPSMWNKITETFNTAPYAAKVSIYRTLIVLWNLPDHIVRTKRRIFAPGLPKPQTLPAPATVATNPLTPPPQKVGRTRKVFRWIFSKDRLQFYGFLFTLAVNGGFAYWVWVHVHVYLDPHTWRLRPLVTSSLGTWTAFTSLEIWMAIMLGIWNLGGCYLIIVGFVLMITWTYEYSGLKWWMDRRRRGKPTPAPQRNNPNNKVSGAAMSPLFVYFLILILWPILASTIPAPRLRVDRYPKGCEGGMWDYRVILDGRVQPRNLTRGRMTIRELQGTQVGREVVYVTENYVNTAWFRTEEKVVLRRMSMPPKEGGVYVIEATFRFPYMETVWEQAGWKSLPDARRERGGNYTVILTDSDTGQNRTVNGRFPYLDDQAGLRLDEMALIPDVKRSWRTIATSTESCPWGPDAKLLENTDPGARNLVGEGYPVLQTDMTKFGKCSELTVCANRRRQVVDGLPWAQGEDGKRVLDEMLVVPLGLILVEQIRWGSCCGDGFEPYKAAPPPAS
ncbi:hypothetical protein TWF281_000406 [Arthrobotrys megalospora]